MKLSRLPFQLLTLFYVGGSDLNPQPPPKNGGVYKNHNMDHSETFGQFLNKYLTPLESFKTPFGQFCGCHNFFHTGRGYLTATKIAVFSPKTASERYKTSDVIRRNIWKRHFSHTTSCTEKLSSK